MLSSFSLLPYCGWGIFFLFSFFKGQKYLVFPLFALDKLDTFELLKLFSFSFSLESLYPLQEEEEAQGNKTGSYCEKDYQVSTLSLEASVK